MQKVKQNTTYKKLILLIAIFLVGFISLFTLNQIFTNLINQLDKETKNLESRLIIGEFMAYDVLTIRSLFNELSTITSSKRSRKLVIEEIDKTIKTINESLHIIENGGILKRHIALNIAGHLNTTKTVTYEILDKEQFSLEVIDIRPKIIEIRSMITEIEEMLDKRATLKRAKDYKEFMKVSKKLQRYYKTLPPFFNRVSENIRRLLYEGEIELQELRTTIQNDKSRYLQLKLMLILVVIAIVLIFGYMIVKRVNEDSKKLHTLNIDLNDNLAKQEQQEKYIRAILDNQPNIIVVSDGEHMLDSNKKLLEFFNQYKSIDQFRNEHECICEFFDTKIPSDEYMTKEDKDGLTWSDYILKNPYKNLKVIMKKDGIKHHFSILATRKILNEETQKSVIIISLNDITAEINSQLKLKSLNDNLEFIVANKTKELQELNENLEQKVLIEAQKVREKDKQMMQQARFAALGEMIGNIAHQWRQPLSAINTTASGMQLQMQLGLTTNEDIKDSYGRIMGYVDFLTQTIEDFRGFFKEDKETTDFNIIETLEKSLSITSATYKDHDIHIFKDFKDSKFISHGMPSELSQVFLNILNNAKDATISNHIENKNVYILVERDKNYNNIYIQDNAGGIPDDILEKVFDPYFTTKHQSQGTGIGLYMSRDIVEKHMNGKLSVTNKNQILNGKKYSGACFKVSIPIKN